MEDLVITKEQLIEMFAHGELKDDNNGWLLNGMPIDIIALHDEDPKYVYDVTNAAHYKLVAKRES